MNVDTQTNDKIKISLSDSEIKELFGSYEMINYENPHSKLILGMLLESSACDNFQLDCEKILIEVKPEKNGCVIIYTKLNRKCAKRLKKSEKNYDCAFIFDNSESMIRCIGEIDEVGIKSNSLYEKNGKYILTVKGNTSFIKTLPHINEYCSKALYKDIVPYAKEHLKCIMQKNAIQKIKTAFF